MSVGIPRLAVDNLFTAAASTRSVSDADSSAPLDNLLDQLRSKAWRTESGWTIVASFNDRLDFYDGSNRTANLTPGNYSTGSALAAEIQTAMNAVSSNCTCSYSGTTYHFTIGRTSGTLHLRWNSGSNKARSICVDLGFFDSSDQSGSSSYESSLTVFQSRHWIKVDLGSSAPDVSTVVVLDHNLGANGVMEIAGNPTDAS